MKLFEMVEHTGDIKMKAYGPTMEELFANAAGGMMQYLYREGGHCENPRKEMIFVQSSDREQLLVDWLSELLAISDTHNEAAETFVFKKLTDTELEAEVGFCKDVAEDDIKAVTYHELEIKEREDGWEATIVFDI